MQPVPQFDRENMRQLGQMLSMFSQGTVALLSSRSILKRGVKADMTMVLDDANNPFKLLPSGKTVLMQMFGTPDAGLYAADKIGARCADRSAGAPAGDDLRDPRHYRRDAAVL